MTTPVEHIHKVYDNLYIGDACARDSVEELGISVVVCLTTETMGMRFYPLPLHVKEVRFFIDDNVDVYPLEMTRILDAAYSTIVEAHKQGKKVLVHCSAGVSRSASVVIDFIMKKEKLSFEEAYAKLKSIRSCVKPNSLFRKILEGRQTK